MSADGRTARFADGSSLDVDAVVWATGYRSDYSWIDVPRVLGDGGVVHRRGVTEVAGLYFVGLSWQHTRGSALLGFVGEDAAPVAMAARRRSHHLGVATSPEAGRLGASTEHRPQQAIGR